MSLSVKDLKIITEDVHTNALTLDYSKLRPETPPTGTTCSCNISRTAAAFLPAIFIFSMSFLPFIEIDMGDILNYLQIIL